MGLKALKILSVAGFDGSGGAGIISDAKIFSKFKILGLSAVTAMTAQNPDNIYSVEPVSDAFFSAELNAVFGYFSVDAVKTGLIFNESQSLILERFLKKYNPKTVVIDPVFISTSGKKLTAESGYPGLLAPLLKYATVITPNIKEAELISGTEIKNVEGMKNSAKIIRKKFPEIKNILIKGSHIIEESDVKKIFNIILDSNDNFFISETKRLSFDKEIHGTGCAFSACLASLLAKGAKIEYSLTETEKFVSKIIRDFRKIPDNTPEKKIYITGNI
jgi:Hydroxymethylpyrimidine/phosphomethylpyrimidine kinase